MAVDGASLLAAAIRVACQAGARRRTVQAVASAVTAILVRPAAAVPRRESRTPAGAPGDAAGEADDAPALLASLRAVRQAQRARKKERRRAAKVAAATAPSTNPADAAGRGPSSGEAQALALALASAISRSAPSSGTRLCEFPPAWPGAAGLAQPAASSGSVEVDGCMSVASSASMCRRSFSSAPTSEASGPPALRLQLVSSARTPAEPDVPRIQLIDTSRSLRRLGQGRSSVPGFDSDL